MAGARLLCKQVESEQNNQQTSNIKSYNDLVYELVQILAHFSCRKNLALSILAIIHLHIASALICDVEISASTCNHDFEKWRGDNFLRQTHTKLQLEKASCAMREVRACFVAARSNKAKGETILDALSESVRLCLRPLLLSLSPPRVLR